MATIRAKILALHRIESYPGESLPELLVIADQSTLEENPEWFDGEVKKVKESVGSDAAAWAVLDIELDEAAVMAALYPRHVVSAEITGSDR